MLPSKLLVRYLLVMIAMLSIHPDSWAQHREITGFKNYIKAGERIHSCGSIRENDLEIISQQGIKTVISLNTESPSEVILLRSKASVLGIDYVHIPVAWKNPTLSSLLQFFEAMDEHPNAEVLVHCQINWRASAFIYLYRTLRLKEREVEALETMHEVWRPERNGTWRRFMQEAKEYFESTQ